MNASALEKRVCDVARRATDKPERLKPSPNAGKKQTADLFELESPLSADERATPNQLVRSALFTANNRNTPRKMMNETEIFAYGNSVSMKFSGEELRAEDEAFWMNLVYLYQGQPKGEVITASRHQLVRMAGRKPNGKTYQWCDSVMARLHKASIQIRKAGERMMLVSLLEDAYVVESTDKRSTDGLWSFRLSESTVKLFAGNQFTKVDLLVREQLKAGIATKLGKPRPMGNISARPGPKP